MNALRLLEIRSYTLKPGSGAAFHSLVSERSVPLLREACMDVVAFGQSVHDSDHYFLMRSYDSLAHRQEAQETFYSSAAWRQGPREAIIALIETDATTTLWLSAEAVERLRSSNSLS